MLTRNLAERTVCWLTVVKGGADFALRLHHVRDEGNPELLDVYEFQPVDEDDEFGEGRLVGRYEDAQSVLEAVSGMGGRPDRWVNPGVIQDEYADLRKAMR